MEQNEFLIRKASTADAVLLSELGALTFTQAFAAQNTAENFARYLAGAFYPEKQAQELATPDSTFFVIERGGIPAGYARLQGDSTRGCVTAERPVELVRFYVLEEWKGKGVAQELMSACLEAALSGGYDVIWLSAWKENPRALAFYRKCGFSEVGVDVFIVGDDIQQDVIMARPVSDLLQRKSFGGGTTGVGGLLD